jgi:hypothetical protein
MLALEGYGQAIDRFNPDTIKTIALDTTVKVWNRNIY